MKIGLALPHLGAQATTENIREFALHAERNGWDSLWTGDRTLYPVNPKTPYPARADGKVKPSNKRVFEHLTVLSYVAAITERVRLGVSVLILPFYNPVLLGRRLATLDQLSHGRVVVGAGLGWSVDEYEAAGTSFRERGRIFEETVRALRAVWGPDPVEFSGEYHRIPASIIGPKPVQDPLPIVMGGFSPKALDRVGRLADGFTAAAVDVDRIVEMTGRVRQAATPKACPRSSAPTSNSPRTVRACRKKDGSSPTATGTRSPPMSTGSPRRASTRSSSTSTPCQEPKPAHPARHRGPAEGHLPRRGPLKCQNAHISRDRCATMHRCRSLIIRRCGC